MVPPPIILKLQSLYPDIVFVLGQAASWSPQARRITYTDLTADTIPSLFHELGHALLGHTTYATDIELIKMEAEAWERARHIAADHDIVIDDTVIQNALDTYRDWLYARSTCPLCKQHGVQPSMQAYTCFNCHSSWSVSPARFCRPYRRSIQK